MHVSDRLEDDLKGFEHLMQTQDPNGGPGISSTDITDKETVWYVKEYSPRVVTKKQIKKELGKRLSDYTDHKISDQAMMKMKNPEFVSLDNANNMVNFLKVANANMLADENEFDTQVKSTIEETEVLDPEE